MAVRSRGNHACVRDGGAIGGGLAVDHHAGEVCVDGVAGCCRQAGVGNLLNGVFEAADGEVGEDADDLLGWREAGADLRSRMQSASAMHWSTINWQLSVLSVRLMPTRLPSSAWTACSSIRKVSS
jgi:hypothetical protein